MNVSNFSFRIMKSYTSAAVACILIFEGFWKESFKINNPSLSKVLMAKQVSDAGNWKRPNGKGRTLYIGCRESGKSCRIYEKGKEQGCEILTC